VFIGHFALGFAAKRAAPRVSLALLFVAAQWADLLWPVLLAAGIEQVRIDPGNTAFTPLDFVSYPWSHSLVTLALWGVLVGFAYRATTGKNGSTFVVLALLVVSHWLLDFLTHRPDMPLYPGGPKVGLGLWNSVTATVLVEVVMYGLGVWVYMRATRALDGVGRWSFFSLALFLFVAYFANLASGPPPSVQLIWVSAIIASALLLVWAWWTDRHRAPRSA
jgi:membrane-bound metal-dependent hydrolase YbcI (DUF457 family)